MESQALEINKTLDYFIIFIFELFGTSVLAIAVNLGYRESVDIVSTGLFAAILLTKRVSGSHLNPGVTLAIGIIEKANQDRKKMLVGAVYVIAQILGGYLGLGISYAIKGSVCVMQPVRTSEDLLIHLTVEFIFSWIFLTIYTYSKVDWVSPSQDFGLRAYTMMGITYACITMAFRTTGGALNPAISLGTVTFGYMVNGNQNNAKYLVAYIIGPLLSGVLAGIYIRHFAIKVTPQTPGTGSPFLAPRLRRGINESPYSPSGTLRKITNG
jgi:glycerol uptake facilitator-like aquaporin